MYRLSYFDLLAQRIGDTTAKARFDRDRHDQRLATLRLVTFLLALFYFSYIPVDMYLLPDIGLRSLLIRFFVVGPLAVLLLFYYQRPVPIRHKEFASIGVVSVATLVWCIVLLGTDNPRVLHYFYAGLVFQLVLTIVLAPPFEQSVYASIVVCLCLYTTIWFLPGADKEYVINHLVVGVPTVVLTLMANYRFSTESLRLYLQNLNTDTLRAELAERNENLDKISHIDPLTGLANRRGLSRHAAALALRRRARDQRVALVLIDVDHFKAFNDTYGHDAGDHCLKQVAQAIQSACGPQDTACRYGGEEFLVLHTCNGLDALSSAALGERIRATVAALDLAHRESEHACVTVSVGICVGILEQGDALTPLILEADRALYAAKRAGRNRVREGRHDASSVIQLALFDD